MNIILIGLKSSGKTTIGQALAEAINWPFLDTDILVEYEYEQQAEQRLPYKIIHQTLGPMQFANLEYDAISRFDKNMQTIIATGGSTALNSENLELLQKAGKIFYLNASPELLKSRWQKHPPSFIDRDNLDQELKQYYEKRADKYAEIANVNIDVNQRQIDEIVNEIVDQIETD